MAWAAVIIDSQKKQIDNTIVVMARPLRIGLFPSSIVRCLIEGI